MMKVPVYVVVTPFFPSPTNWRGAYCYDFVASLNKDGRYRVEVFVPGQGLDYTIGDISVHSFPTRTLPSNLMPFLFAKWNQHHFLMALRRIGIEPESVAICHGHTANFAIYPLAVKARNPKCLTLLHHHDLGSFGLNIGILRHCWLNNMFLYPKLRTLHEKVDCHVFISEAVRKSFLSAPKAQWSVYDDYRKQMQGLPYRSARIRHSVILHNGINTVLFNKRNRRITNPVFTIGCVGNFIHLKDQMSLLIAVSNIGDVKVIFVGSGPERVKCEEYARRHDIDAEFRNEVRHELLPEFYRSIDLFVLPSYFEGLGCVFIEAWACGTPFISCEGQGIDDLIYEEDRSIWLCKPRDPDDLAQKIKNYIKLCDSDKLVSNFVDQIEVMRKATIST